MESTDGWSLAGAPAVPAAPDPPDEKATIGRVSPLARAWRECVLLASLTFFGIAGSMARNGLVQLTAFEGYGSIWPNFTGCLIISLSPAVVSGDLLVPLTTGFCGSLTSFSELITDIFLASTTPKPSWPNHGYGVPLFIARLIIELSSCFAGYMGGTHLGALVGAILPRPSLRLERLLNYVCGIVGVAAWVVCLVTSITSPNRHRWWPMNGLFAPFGVWARYYLSKLNRPSVWFKWGTFATNFIGTLLACVFQVCTLLYGPTVLQKQFLEGLQRGLCGCMTTISTFVKEMCTSPKRYGYPYGIITLFVGFALAFIIIGSYKWTVE